MPWWRRLRVPRWLVLLLALASVAATGVSINFVKLSADCGSATPTGAQYFCFDTSTHSIFTRQDTLYVQPGGGGTPPTLQHVVTQGNTYSGATSAGAALTVTDGGGTPKGCRIYVSGGVPRVECFDGSTVLTFDIGVYSGQTFDLTIDNGSGTQIDCATMNDAGLLTFTSTNESCGRLAGLVHLEFAEDDGTHACAAGNYGIWADLSEQKLKACQNGGLSDLVGAGGGGTGDINDVGTCSTGSCFQSQVQNQVFASPNGSTGQALFRALVDADIPDTITASNYQPLDAALTALAGGSDFVAFSGPATATKTFTLPDASSTILTTNAAVTVAQGGTGLTSGTSGGVPYFSGATTVASSGALTANAVVIGGGAGAAPSAISADTTTTHALMATAGAPAFRALTDADIPDTITASNYQPLDAALTALAGGSDFVTFSGPASATKTFTLPNASATILTSNAAVTVAQGGTGLTSGTSGGIPYFSGSTTVASSAALTANAVVIGGGAGTTPSTISASTTTTHALMATAGAPAFRALVDADIPDTITASNYLPLAGGTVTGATTFNTPPTFGTTKPLKSIGLPPSGWKTFGAAALVTDTAVITGGLAEDFLRVTDSDSDGFHRRFPMPASWDGGTLTVRVWAICARASCAGNLVIHFSALCVQDSGAETTTISTTGEQAVTLVFDTQNDNETAVSAAITPNGTCTAPTMLRLQGQVDATGTTLDTNELLETSITGVLLQYAITSTTD